MVIFLTYIFFCFGLTGLMEKGVLEFDQQVIPVDNHCFQECSTLIDEERIMRNKRRRDQRAQKKKNLQRKSRNAEMFFFKNIY